MSLVKQLTHMVGSHPNGTQQNKCVSTLQGLSLNAICTGANRGLDFIRIGAIPTMYSVSVKAELAIVKTTLQVDRLRQTY